MTLVALDVGTTNSRAWLLDGGTILARATRTTGVRDAAAAGSTAPVRGAVRDLVAQVSAPAAPKAIVAAGMITSSLGVRAVAHVPAPAGMDDLARHAETFVDTGLSPLPMTLLPGVRTDGPELLARDVMRGEETLVVGLLRDRVIPPGAAVLNASSHWKLIVTDDRGRIAMSRTTLGGEVVHAVTRHTLLAESVPARPLTTPHIEWIKRGADASRTSGLLRALFAVRLLHQEEQTTAVERQSWLVGASIGADVEALVRGGTLRPGSPMVVTGPAAMPQAWVCVLASYGIEASPLPPVVVERGFLSGMSAIFERVRERPGAQAIEE